MRELQPRDDYLLLRTMRIRYNKMANGSLGLNECKRLRLLGETNQGFRFSLSEKGAPMKAVVNYSSGSGSAEVRDVRIPSDSRRGRGKC